MRTTGRELVLRETATALEPYDPYRADTRALNKSVRWPVLIGVFLVALFVAGFGVWASVVPLAGGAVAPGIISPDGSRRTVQHLEGGIIRKLHVRDGDRVEKDQPLLLLESVQPQATYDLFQKQQQTFRITKARLEAERLGKDTVEFPPDLLDAGPEMMDVITSQRELFQVRRHSHESKNRVLSQRIAQLREQIKGYEAQVASASRQIDLIAEEVSGKRTLTEKGYLAKPELLRMLRMEAELAGRKGQYLAAISQGEQQIGEAELQIVANDSERADEVATQLDQVQARLNELDEKLLASGDVLSRTVITAPIAGTIVNLKFKTLSGVIQPGEPILDIVPADEKLLIDAQIKPMDIDVVRKGLEAQVQLTAVSARFAPRIHGVVVSVSADRMIDESTNKPYFLARVEVTRDELRRVGADVELLPGMPADVLIVTGEHTMADYLLKPLMNAVWKTMREV